MHGLADQVLAQHRAHRGLAVATTRERGTPRPLQVQVPAAAVDVDHLAEQERPAVPEPGRVHAELVASVGLGDRRDSRRRLAHQQRDTRRLPQRRGIGAQLPGQFLVEHEQLRSGHRRRRPWHGQARHLASVGIVEPEQGRRHGHTVKATNQAAYRGLLPAVWLLTSSFNHVVDKPVVAVYDYFQPGG